MAVRVLDDGRIEATPESGGDPVVFDPQSAALLNIGPPPPLEEELGLGPGMGAPMLPDADFSALEVTPEEQAQALTLPQPTFQEPAPAPAPEPTAAEQYDARIEQAAQEAADQAVQTSVQPGTGYEDADVAYLDADRRIAGAAGAEKEAIDAQLEAKQAATDAMLEAEASRTLSKDKQIADIETRTTEANKEFADIRAEKEALSKQEPDQSRFWSSRSAMQQTAAYIGAMIQGFLQPGQPNTFVAAIMDQINRDVALQERQISRELDVLEQNAQSLGQEFDRDIAAMKMRFGIEAEKFESVKRYIEIAMENENYRLAATRAKAEIERQEGLRQQAGALGTAKRRTERQILEHKQRLERAEARAKAADRVAKAKAGPLVNDIGETRDDSSVYGVDKNGKFTFRNTVDKVGARELRKLQTSTEPAAAMIEAILTAGPESPIWNPVDDQKQVGANMRKQLMTLMRVALAGGGVTSDKDMALIEEIIPDPGEAITLQTYKARIKTLRNIYTRIQDNVESGYRYLGVEGLKFQPRSERVEEYKASLRKPQAPTSGLELARGPEASDESIADAAAEVVDERINTWKAQQAAFLEGKGDRPANLWPVASPRHRFDPNDKTERQKLIEVEKERLALETRGRELRDSLARAKPVDAAAKAKQSETEQLAANMESLYKKVILSDSATDEERIKFAVGVKELISRGHEVPENLRKAVGE